MGHLEIPVLLKQLVETEDGPRLKFSLADQYMQSPVYLKKGDVFTFTINVVEDEFERLAALEMLAGAAILPREEGTDGQISMECPLRK